jgi:aldose 1-epimerase
MAFQVRTETRPATGGLDGTVYILQDPAAMTRAEVWPANGFNCYRWQIVHDRATWDLLYSDPQFFQGSPPTRSGIPILFPFPNRIRDGRFRWGDREYQLPLNDPARKNAIHGFACRRPWRVRSQGADESGAWLEAEFRGSVDAPEARNLWPADYLVRVSYRLGPKALRVTAVVENPDRVPLPFGLGYHPYFQVPPAPGDYLVQADAGHFWVLDESLPTGELRPVDAARDLRTPRPFPDITLDDVLSSRGDAGPSADAGNPASLVYRGVLSERGSSRALWSLEASPAFRELVVFTPPHRHAVCLEPYTCTTDAINLQQRGVDAGLIVLEPGRQWWGEVVLTFRP